MVRAMSKLYAVIQRSPPAIGSNLIDLGTQAKVPSGWCISPDAPGTHTYVVCDMGDGKLWRLDGTSPGATWRAMERFPALVQPLTGDTKRFPPHWAFGPPTAAWEITGLDTEAGIAKARALTGTQYDWLEIAGQALAAASFLPLLHQLRFLGRMDAFKNAMICTQVVLHVLQACGGPAVELASSLPDLFPERLGQGLRAAEGNWTRRLNLDA
jgi:hypothetical protein